MRGTKGRVGYLAIGFFGAILSAACGSDPDEETGTHASGEALSDAVRWGDSGMCHYGQRYRTKYEDLLRHGSTASYDGQAAFDADASLLFVLADAETAGAVVYRCDVGSGPTSCSALSTPYAKTLVGAANGYVAAIAVTPATTGGGSTTTTTEATEEKNELVTCTYAGLCSRRAVLPDSGGALDVANGNVIVHSPWAQSDGSPAVQFTVCPLVGGACQAPWFQVFDRFDIDDVAVDTVTGNQYIALHSSGGVLECAGSTGTWCAGYAAFTEVGAGDAQLVLDDISVSVLKLVGDDLVLVRCLRAGRTCANQTLDLGAGAHQIENFSSAVDAKRARLLVVTQDGARGEKPTLYSCALDGTGCEESDISAHRGAQDAPRAFFDAARDRLLVTTDGGPPSHLGLFEVNVCKDGGHHPSFTSTTTMKVQ